MTFRRLIAATILLTAQFVRQAFLRPVALARGCEYPSLWIPVPVMTVVAAFLEFLYRYETPDCRAIAGVFLGSDVWFLHMPAGLAAFHLSSHARRCSSPPSRIISASTRRGQISDISPLSQAQRGRSGLLSTIGTLLCSTDDHHPQKCSTGSLSAGKILRTSVFSEQCRCSGLSP